MSKSMLYDEQGGFTVPPEYVPALKEFLESGKCREVSMNVLTPEHIRELPESGQVTVTTNPVGWLCPRCGAINAPDMKRCECKPSEEDLRHGILPNTVVGPSEVK